MKWLYGMILVFSVLSVYFVHMDFRKGAVSKRNFIVALVLECIAALVSVVLLLR